MRKSLYLKLSQQEANKRLQASLFGRYKITKQRNKLLGWLYFIFAYISFSVVTIISFIHRLVMLPKDFRFTQHYIRTVIKHDNMDVVEANAYLDSQLHEYKKSLSYGNFSPQERNSINTTFELLYDEYKLHKSDTKHEEIISNFSTLHQNLQTIGEETNRDLRDIKQETTSISEYTNKKFSEEQEGEKRKLEKAQKETSKYNREKGRNLDSFESALSDKQVGILVKYCNQIPTFNIDITQSEMKAILQCTHTKPLQTTVNKYTALLFSRLSEEKLICETWKSVATKERCFLSAKGKELNAKDLSSANSTSGIIKPQIYDLIEECIDKIKEA